jgi:hypothetical protein
MSKDWVYGVLTLLLVFRTECFPLASDEELHQSRRSSSVAWQSSPLGA